MWGFRKCGGGEPAEYPADSIDCGPIIWSASLAFTLKTRAREKKKQFNHPGCQSAINWIAFQAKLWGWSMARKRLSTRLRLLLGCVCVCVPMKMRVGTRGSSVSRRPSDANPLKWRLCFFGSSPSRRCLRTLAETLGEPRRVCSPCCEPVRSLYAPSNQWSRWGSQRFPGQLVDCPGKRRKDKMTNHCHLCWWNCTVLVFNGEFCFSVFLKVWTAKQAIKIIFLNFWQNQIIKMAQHSFALLPAMPGYTRWKWSKCDWSAWLLGCFIWTTLSH